MYIMNPFAQALTVSLKYAVVSHHISRENEIIGFLYREAAVFENDSGWRIFSGAESDEYVNQTEHFDTILLQDILANHPEIKPLLNEISGAWEWNDDTEQFNAVLDWQPQE